MACAITPNQARRYVENMKKSSTERVSTMQTLWYNRLLVGDVAKRASKLYGVRIGKEEINKIAWKLTESNDLVEEIRKRSNVSFNEKNLLTTIKEAILNSKTIREFFKLMREREEAAKIVANTIENYILREFHKLGLL